MWFRCQLAIAVISILHHKNAIIMGLCDRADHGSQVGSVQVARASAQSSSSLLPAVSSPSSRFSAVVIETVAMTPGARK